MVGARSLALGDEHLREMPKAELHVHAEGTLEPEYTRQALDVLGAERIDHGVRCREHPPGLGQDRRHTSVGPKQALPDSGRRAGAWGIGVADACACASSRWRAALCRSSYTNC